MDKVIVITGPTAVGKTKLSLAVAKHLNTEIINADSTQVYRNMDIGTAKVTHEEQSEVVHHLIDILDPTGNFSIYDYQKQVRALIDQMLAQGKIPLLVGGSGLYLDSVIYDYQLSGEGRNQELEDKYSSLSNEELHQVLQSLDPDKASSIHFNNRKRVLRAIELSIEPTPKINSKDRPLYNALIIFLNDNREVLYKAINERVEEMFEEGLLEEVKRLYPDKIGRQALGAISYKELFRYFDGVWTLEEAKEKIKQATRNYAKRQWTWFRNRKDISIININRNHFDETIEEVLTLIHNFLKS